VISVMRNRYVRALPRAGERVYPLSVGYAMRRSYRTDAHFVAYASATGRRLSRESLSMGAVATIGIIAVDIDCPEVHGSSEPAPPKWRAATLDIVRAIAADHGYPYYYATRGGARIIYRLPAPSWISCPSDESQWSMDYLVTLAYLRRRYGLIGDVACSDWTRLYRLPRATRGEAPECHDTRGNPDRIADLLITPTASDVVEATAIHRPSRAPRDSAPAIDCPRTDGCRIYSALRSHGAILGRHGHAWIIRCPRDEAHSTGRHGDGSTLLYPPPVDSTDGRIYCLHASCRAVRWPEWMRIVAGT
jgi:hypothetical protein